MPDEAPNETSVLAPGQEPVVQRMLTAALPAGWRMLDARIDGGRIVARYVEGSVEGRASVVLELDPSLRGSAARSTTRFGVRARAAGEVRALVSAVLREVRAREHDLVWHPRDAVRGARVAPISPEEVAATLAAVGSGAEVPPTRRRAALLHRFRELEACGRYRDALDLGEAHVDAELALLSAWVREMFRDLGGAARNARIALRSPLRGTRLEAAALLARAGRSDEARRAADAIVSERPSDVAVNLALAALYEAANDPERATALHERALEADHASPGAHLALGERCAWRGDASGARLRAERALTIAPGAAERLLGIVSALEGAHADAAGHFERAFTHLPFDAELGLWRAETWMRLGDLERAREEAQRARDLTADGTSHVPALVVRAVIAARLAQPEPEEPVLAEAMTALVPERSGDLRADLDAALHAMRGNRGTPTTYVRGGALHRLISAPSSRLLAKDALHRFVLAEGPEACVADFAGIQRRFPTLAEPHNYEGEMWLHAGDAARARVSFDRALALNARSRWAFIGLAAVALLEARPEAALVHLARGMELAGGPGPTTYVYRGEALRLLGRHAEARADLEHTLARQPSRIGAWVNLGLVQIALGDGAGLDRTLAALRARARAFVDDATAAGGANAPSVLATMLEMLRGNRASGVVTYYTRDGRLRVVPPATREAVHVAVAR